MPPPHSGTEKTLKRNLLFRGYSGAICLSNSGLLIQKLHFNEGTSDFVCQTAGSSWVYVELQSPVSCGASGVVVICE